MTTKTATKPTTASAVRHSSPSRLSENSRARIIAGLNERLSDGIDLFTQIKVAHWNIKGPHFAALHPLFETYATDVAASNDEVAERAVILGGLAFGTARHVARHSRIDEYPQEITRDLEHVRLLVERLELYLEGLRTTRTLAEEEGDLDTSDLLTTMIEQTEKKAWFLHATLGD